MTFLHVGKLFLSGIVLVLALDALWLGILMAGTYRAEIGALMKARPDWFAAALVYILIVGGTIAFVLPRVSPETSLADGFLWGALFGLVLYGVYDFTNLAVINGWTMKIALLDLAWGGLLGGVLGASLSRLHYYFS